MIHELEKSNIKDDTNDWNITYAVVEEHYALGEIERISYGIVVYSTSALEQTACVVASVCDITSDSKRLLALVQRCNDLQLSVIHLHDIIEDFFAFD